MANLYQQIIYRPIFNLLVFVYNTIGFHDLGLAIILVTLVIRFVLFPFFHKGAKQQMLMQRIQPHVKKIQETHKDDKEKQTKALMELYKEHGVNPFSGILLLIIQLPILITLYHIFLSGLGPKEFSALYHFVSTPQMVNSTFLGLVDLKAQSIFLVACVAIAQYIQTKLAIYRRKDGQAPTNAEKMAQRMAFIGPLVTVIIFFRLPAAVALYWLVSSLFSIVQQMFVNKKLEASFGAEKK